MNTIEIYKKYCNDCPVIDIGCGTIYNLFDFDYVRFDKAKFYMFSNSETTANCYGDFHEMPFENNYFAFINAVNCIEHAEFIEKALQEWTRILKVGGIMYIKYPEYLPKATSEQRKEVYAGWIDALNKNDLNLYKERGGLIGWVSKKPNGELFLDGHYNVLSVTDFKNILPKNLKILEEELNQSYFIVLRKEIE